MLGCGISIWRIRVRFIKKLIILISIYSGGITKMKEEPKIEQFPMGKIVADKDQPRKTFKAVRELADDIEIHGLMHNIAINGGNKIIYGERRYRACKLLGWKTIPAKIYKNDLTTLERIELQLAENSSREDIPIIDKAKCYERFCKAYQTDADAAKVSSKHTSVDFGYKKLAKIENCAESQIRAVLSLLKAPVPIQEALNEGIVRVSHIVEAMAIKDDRSRKIILDRIMSESKFLAHEVKELNKEYDAEMNRIAKEKRDGEERAAREAKKRQDQLRFLEKMKLKAKAEDKKRIEQEQKRKIQEDKDAKEREEKERIRLQKEVAAAKKKKQEAEKEAKEKKDIIQGKQETRGLKNIINNPKISDKIKEAVAKGLIKSEQITASFEDLDEEEQREQLAEMIKSAQDATGEGTAKRIALDKFLKKNQELMKVPELFKDEDEREFRAAVEEIELTLISQLSSKIMYNLTSEQIERWLSASQKVRLYSQVSGLVRDMIKLMNNLDDKYKYEIQKEEK